MNRSLNGCTLIRPAGPDDAAGIGRVHINSARAAFRGIVPDSVIDNMDYRERAQHWRRRLTDGHEMLLVFVAEHSECGIVGYVAGGASDSGIDGFSGEIYNIYLEPEHQRAGLGRRLLSTCAGSLHAHGHRSLLIWTMTENPFGEFYRRLGGAPVATKYVTFGSTTLEETAFGWKNLSMVLE